MTLLAPLITAFLRERLPADRGASEHTCATYAYAFKLLFEYTSKRLKTRPSRLTVEQFEPRLLLDFLDHLERKRGNSVTTRNARLAAIKSFVRFVEYQAPSALELCRRILALPFKKTESKLVRYLSIPEMTAVLNAPDIRRKSGIRDRAMLHLCFAAGLRVSELVTLPLSAIRLLPGPSIYIVGKGRRERNLPLWKEAVVDLRAWLAVRGQALTPELFLNARGSPLTRAGFEYILGKHIDAAAKSCPSLLEKRVSPHVLRHTCAMIVYQATRDLRQASLWLGHASMKTTEVYLRADPSEKLDAVQAITPSALRRGRFRAPDKAIAELLRDDT
jgi:site-specific recombinase XerD